MSDDFSIKKIKKIWCDKWLKKSIKKDILRGYLYLSFDMKLIFASIIIDKFIYLYNMHKIYTCVWMSQRYCIKLCKCVLDKV